MINEKAVSNKNKFGHKVLATIEEKVIEGYYILSYYSQPSMSPLMSGIGLAHDPRSIITGTEMVVLKVVGKDCIIEAPAECVVFLLDNSSSKTHQLPPGVIQWYRLDQKMFSPGTFVRLTIENEQPMDGMIEEFDEQRQEWITVRYYDRKQNIAKTIKIHFGDLMPADGKTPKITLTPLNSSLKAS